MSRKALTKEEMEERDHFRNVLMAFKAYKRDSAHRISRSYSNMRKLPLAHQKLLNQHGFSDHLQTLESCVEINYSILMDIISDAATMFSNSSNVDDHRDATAVDRATPPMDVEKVQSTLKQFVRDWSDDGAEERRLCYEPILNALRRVSKGRNPSEVKVLVPGAGLGRLAYDIAKMGFESEGNEFSLFMLFASNFVLNRCKFRNCFTIYPWMHQFNNNLRSQDALRPAKFPDIDPSDLPEDSQFSMVAGDFLEVYSAPEHAASRDAVVTCFFLDCAHNVLEFVQLIHRILKPGGHWINLGPLLYHFADAPKEASIEPSYEIVRGLVEETGFKFLQEVTDHQATYCQNPKSMLQYHYRCVFFTCVKR